jgi:invasion protein IalB
MAAENGKKFQDWTVRCEKPAEAKTEVCFIFQTLVDEKAKQAVLQTVVGYLSDGKQPAMIFTVPLGVALRAGIGIKIDDGELMRLPYENCNPAGCIAGLPLDDKLLSTLKRGIKGTVIIHDGGGRQVTLEVSLKGFTAGFESLP